MAISVLGPLPELAAVAAAGEHRTVFLRLVSKNRLLLLLQVVRAERHDPLDDVRLPLLPRPSVQPHLELQPLRAYPTYRLENRLRAGAVRAVRVRHLPGDVNLRGPDAPEKGRDVVHVQRVDRGLGEGAG